MKTASEREIPFERALEKLEALLSGMETGEVPLADLIERFEEGNRLLAICSRRLRDAEQKIELLKQDRETVSFENFDQEKP